jgi:hypothetical protein
MQMQVEDVVRVLAPRPVYMSPLERQEYTEIHRFYRERREQNAPMEKVFCRFYNMSGREVDVIWCREEVSE